jgi:hypothetical protein
MECLIVAPTPPSSVRGTVWRSRGPTRAAHNRSIRHALQQSSELLDCKTSISDNPTHREGVDRIAPWDGQEARSIGHHDMFSTFTDNAESRFFERSNSIPVIDARKLRHS